MVTKPNDSFWIVISYCGYLSYCGFYKVCYGFIVVYKSYVTAGLLWSTLELWWLLTHDFPELQWDDPPCFLHTQGTQAAAPETARLFRPVAGAGRPRNSKKMAGLKV